MLAAKQIFDNVGEEITIKVPNALRKKSLEVFLVEVLDLDEKQEPVSEQTFATKKKFNAKDFCGVVTLDKNRVDEELVKMREDWETRVCT